MSQFISISALFARSSCMQSDSVALRGSTLNTIATVISTEEVCSVAYVDWHIPYNMKGLSFVVICSLVDTFLELTEQYLNDFKNAKGERSRLFMVHKIKGVVGTMGACVLAADCVKMAASMNCSDDDVSQLSAKYQLLHDSVKRWRVGQSCIN